MKVGDLVKYAHWEDIEEHGDKVGLIIAKFQRNTTVSWIGPGEDIEVLDGWALEVISESR